MTTWLERAWAAIDRVDRSLPADATLAERTRAVDEAYPFGERAHHPYKMWLNARALYLGCFGYKKKPHLSPLERQKARAEELAGKRP